MGRRNPEWSDRFPIDFRYTVKEHCELYRPEYNLKDIQLNGNCLVRNSMWIQNSWSGNIIRKLEHWHNETRQRNKSQRLPVQWVNIWIAKCKRILLYVSRKYFLSVHFHTRFIRAIVWCWKQIYVDDNMAVIEMLNFRLDVKRDLLLQKSRFST